MKPKIFAVYERNHYDINVMTPQALGTKSKPKPGMEEDEKAQYVGSGGNLSFMNVIRIIKFYNISINKEIITLRK